MQFLYFLVDSVNLQTFFSDQVTFESWDDVQQMAIL